MSPDRADVERMVVALFTLNAGLDRARRESPGAGRLSVLQVLTAPEGERPSDIANTLQVSPSLVTRHVQELEGDGLARFPAFVAGWDTSDVVNLPRLLERLEIDKHTTAEPARRRSRRPRWAQDSAPDRERGL